MKLLLLFGLAILATGCSKEEPMLLNQDNLIGVWYTDSYRKESKQLVRYESHFKNDNTVESIEVELDPYSREVLGYISSSSGSYKLDDLNVITFFNLVEFEKDSGKRFSDEFEGLFLVEDNEYDSYAIICELSSDGQILTTRFKGGCGDLENCYIAPVIYVRK
jgi:hypothetical protein